MKALQPAIIVALIFIAAILAIQSCELRSQLESSHALMTLNDSLLQEKIEVIRDSAGREISHYKLQTITANQFATSESEEAATVRDQLDRANATIQDLHASISIASQTIDTIYVEQIDTLGSGLDTLIAADSTQWLQYSFRSYFNNNVRTGYTLNYSVRNDVTATWLWKGRQAELMITQQNPFTTTGRIQTYTIVYDRKWHEKWYITGPIGFATGFVATTLLLSK